MADTARVVSSTLGDLTTYTLGSTVILFRNGAKPALIINGTLASIDYPERFGSWYTVADRRAYVRAFVAASTPASPT